MSLKDDVLEMQKEVKKVKKDFNNNSFAMELLKTQNDLHHKKAIGSFIVIMTLIVLLFAETIFMFHTLDDIGTTKTTQEIDNVDCINGQIVNNGDING